MQKFMRTGKTNILLLSLLVLGWLTACSNPAPAANQEKEELGPPDRVDVVFFYDSQICSCQAAPGERIQTTLFYNFSQELANGKLTFQNIDLNKPNNAVIVNKYQAKSLSLFVNVVRGDTEHIIAIPEILLVKDDDAAIDELVINRISRYLAGEE